MGIPSALTQRVRDGPGRARRRTRVLRSCVRARLGAAASPSGRAFGGRGARGARERARTIARPGEPRPVRLGPVLAAPAAARGGLVKEVLAEVQPAGGKPPEAVDLAARLPWRGVVATCFHDSLGADAEERAGPPPGRRGSWSTGPEDGWRTGVSPFLLHALGTWSDPESLCFSPADLRRRPVPAAVASFLRALFARAVVRVPRFSPGRSRPAADPATTCWARRPPRPSTSCCCPKTPRPRVRPAGGHPGRRAGSRAGARSPAPWRSCCAAGSTAARPTAATRRRARASTRREVTRTCPDARTDPVIQPALLAWVREQQAHIDGHPAGRRAPLYERDGRRLPGAPTQPGARHLLLPQRPGDTSPPGARR